MFCKNCGAEMEDSAKFCGACGTAVEGIAVQAAGAVANVAADRNKVLSDIDTAYPYAEQAEVCIGNLYELQSRRDTVTALKQSGRKAKKQLVNTLKDYGYEKVKLFRVIKYISILVFAASILSESLAEGLDSYAVAKLAGLLLLVSFVAIIVTHILGKIELKKAIKDLDNKVATDGQRYYDEGCNILSEYATNYGVISSNYMNTQALEYMRQTIVDGRADTLKEALNLFAAYEAQLRLERAQDERYQELLRQQEEMRNDIRRGNASSDLGDALILFGLYH